MWEILIPCPDPKPNQTSACTLTSIPLGILPFYITAQDFLLPDFTVETYMQCLKMNYIQSLVIWDRLSLYARLAWNLLCCPCWMRTILSAGITHVMSHPGNFFFPCHRKMRCKVLQKLVCSSFFLAGLELVGLSQTHGDATVSASQVLRLKVWEII